jgi:pimeloyl-ACP methyl ester carboxylesterase
MRESEGSVLDSVYQHAGARDKPTLLVWGKEDKTVPIENAPSVLKAIPQAQYHPIEHAGHLPHMERPDLVNPLLVTFLRAGPLRDSVAARR